MKCLDRDKRSRLQHNTFWVEMKIDKDKPWTWIKYSEGLCASCRGECCTMPVEVSSADLIKLNLCTEDEILHAPKKTAKRLIKDGVLQSYREGTGLYMLSAAPSGECYFLDSKTRKCRVYEQRPQVCRQFPTEVGPRRSYCPYRKKI